MEKTLRLESIEPIDFYGVHDANLNLLKNYFPKLKIIARGEELKIFGEKKEIQNFENKLFQLLDYFNEHNMLDMEDIKQIIIEGKINNKPSKKNLILHGNSGKAINTLNNNQQQLVELANDNELLFVIGPAGTGKTYVSIALAVKALRTRKVKRIILSRPAVEAGETLGFLPGDLREKIDPYLQPLYDALLDMIPPKKLADYLESEIIQIAPLAYMRGRTLNNAFVILDEAQNTTRNQLKMFLTRMGTNAKFIITGDITQIDLPSKKDSGLLEASSMLKGIHGIAFLEFEEGDIVRNKLVKKIVKAYEKLEMKNSENNANYS